MSATTDLLDFAAADHHLPPRVRADTLRLLGDALAVGAAGATAPGMDGVLSVARSWGTGGQSRLLGRAERLPAHGAAYVNGFAVHCLEWDAVHEAAVVHSVSSITAGLLAAIDRKGGHDPEETLTALAVGIDIASGLGLAAETGLKFFRPATAGIFGTALAIARIEGLNRSQFADVLGLAHAHAAGTMQAHSEGSIALPLQFANAVRGALHAVDLVKNGLTGAHDVLEGEFGHFSLFETGDLSTYTRDLGTIWRVSEVSTKPFPSGRASHATLGTLADIRASGRVIERVRAHVPPLIAQLVGRPYRTDMAPAYARLCLPFLSALMIREGRIDPRRFTTETYADPVIRDIAAKVEVLVDGNNDPNALSPQRLEVIFADGDHDDIAVPKTLGTPEAPMSAQQSAAKANLCRALAAEAADPRLFDDPLAYCTDPR
jgi:2-methylcitrate dehydratase PrpD